MHKTPTFKSMTLQKRTSIFLKQVQHELIVLIEHYLHKLKSAGWPQLEHQREAQELFYQALSLGSTWPLDVSPMRLRCSCTLVYEQRQKLTWANFSTHSRALSPRIPRELQSRSLLASLYISFPFSS